MFFKIFNEYTIAHRILEDSISRYEMFKPVLCLKDRFLKIDISNIYCIEINYNEKLIYHYWNEEKHIDPLFFNGDDTYEIIIYNEDLKNIDIWNLALCDLNNKKSSFMLEYYKFKEEGFKQSLISKFSLEDNPKIIINKIGKYDLIKQSLKEGVFEENVIHLDLNKKDLPFIYEEEIQYNDYQAIIVSVDKEGMSWEEKYIYYGQLGYEGKYKINLDEATIKTPYHDYCLNNKFKIKIFEVKVVSYKDIKALKNIILKNNLNSFNNYFDICMKDISLINELNFIFNKRFTIF